MPLFFIEQTHRTDELKERYDEEWWPLGIYVPVYKHELTIPQLPSSDNTRPLGSRVASVS